VPTTRAFCFVAVFSQSAEEAEEIAGAARAFGASCGIALTPARLREILVETPCNGLLLSVSSMIRIDSASKALIRTLEQIYPAARAKRKPSDRSLSVMASNGSVARTLPDFLSACAAFPARRIRRHERIARTLNVLLHDDPDAAEAEQTFSLDLSAGGSLLHSVRERQVGEIVHLSFLELPWGDPVKAEIRHVFPWGIPYHARSIGVQFEGMAPGHAENLAFLLYGKASR
jgi:hypothetical protein